MLNKRERNKPRHHHAQTKLKNQTLTTVAWQALHITDISEIHGTKGRYQAKCAREVKSQLAWLTRK